jgi:hypothetical protein
MHGHGWRGSYVVGLRRVAGEGAAGAGVVSDEVADVVRDGEDQRRSNFVWPQTLRQSNS